MPELNNLLFVPNAALRETARKVEESEFGAELGSHMDKMAQIMNYYGGVGLAGPQVEDPRRLFIMALDEKGDSIVKIVNPEIIATSEEMVPAAEGCLSLPEFRIDISRHYSVTLSFQDSVGKPHTQEFEGLPAIIIQHEIDHLNGKTMLDHAGRVSRTMYLKKIKKHMRKAKRAAIALRKQNVKR
jgi:peptide deformylase